VILHGALSCVHCRQSFRSLRQAEARTHTAGCHWYRPTPDGHRYTVARELVRYPAFGAVVMEQINTFDTRAEAEACLERLKGAA